MGQIVVRIPDELEDYYRRRAEEEGTSLSIEIRVALRAWEGLIRRGKGCSLGGTEQPSPQ